MKKRFERKNGATVTRRWWLAAVFTGFYRVKNGTHTHTHKEKSRLADSSNRNRTRSWITSHPPEKVNERNTISTTTTTTTATQNHRLEARVTVIFVGGGKKGNHFSDKIRFQLPTAWKRVAGKNKTKQKKNPVAYRHTKPGKTELKNRRRRITVFFVGK